MFIHVLIFLLFLTCFKDTIFWLFQVLILIAVILFSLKKMLSFSFSWVKLSGLLIFFVINLINTYTLHSNIISGICLLFGLYFLIGFYLRSEYWKRGFYLLLIFSLTLPVLEYIHIFLGFPIRLMTAKVISSMFSLIGVENITESTVILIENSSTSIDYPCSGIKSIYAGSIFMFALYFIKNARISLRMLFLSAVFLFSLIFFNIWRVFSLVLIDNVLNIAWLADKIHILLGVIGFVVSCLLLWYLTEQYLSCKNQEKPDITYQKSWHSYILISILAVFSSLNLFLPGFAESALPAKNNSEVMFNIELPGVELTEIPMSEKEAEFAEKHPDFASKKYVGRTSGGKAFTLLTSTSNSWRFLHNPEICLKGQGYKIKSSKILRIQDKTLKELTLSNGKKVIYWFYYGEKTIADYPEYVWHSILHPDKKRVLILLGVDNLKDTTLLKKLLSLKY